MPSLCAYHEDYVCDGCNLLAGWQLSRGHSSVVAGHISACLHYLYRSTQSEEFCWVAFDVPQKNAVTSHPIQQQGAVVLPEQNAAKDAQQ